MIGLIQRHGKVVLQGQRPPGDRVGAAIDDRNLFQIRQVYIDIWPRRFQLEGLWMGSQFVFFLDARVGCCIDRPDCRGVFITVADINTLVRSVVPQVIDVAVEVYRRDEVERVSVVNVQLALAAPNKQLVRFGSVDNALRVWHSRYRVLQRSTADVDHLDGVVAQCRDKQFPSAGTKMIETSLYAL